MAQFPPPPGPFGSYQASCVHSWPANLISLASGLEPKQGISANHLPAPDCDSSSERCALHTEVQDPLALLAQQLGAGTTGAPLGSRHGGAANDPTTAAWQEYEQGIVYYDPAYGASWIYPTETAQLWKANQGTLGAPEQSTVDWTPSPNQGNCAQKKGYGGTITYFTGGGIVQVSNFAPVILIGATWIKYLQLDDVSGDLGAPIPNKGPFKGAGSGPLAPVVTGFACGWIVEAVSASGIAPAFYMIDTSPIAKAHQASLYSLVGFPISDEYKVIKSFQVGNQQRFSAGVILYSPSTGAQGLTANLPNVAGRKSLLEEYEQTYGGPTGILGFPTSAIQTIHLKDPNGVTVSVYALNTEKGVLVWYPASAGQNLPWGTTQAFTSVSVFFSNFKTYGCDNCPIFGSDQDPWFDLVLKSQPTGTIVSRIPPTGNFNDNPNVVINAFSYQGSKKLVVPKASANTVISLTFSATDKDTTSADDPLGTVTNTLSIANGFGVFAPFDQKNNDFEAFYALKRDAAIAALATKNQPFRYNYQWAFRNFGTDELSEDQMADTFSDIGRDEFVLWHPFHKLFYEYVYKSIAKDGNCFGMALSATWAQMGRSAFSPPLALYGSASSQNGGSICTDSSKPCGPDNVTPQNNLLVLDVNMHHGMQLNAVVGNKGLDLYVQMLQTNYNVLNGHLVFADAEARHKAGDPQLISFAYDLEGHTVRAYKFARNQVDSLCSKVGVSTCHIMYISDSNHPYTTAEASNPDKYKLAVHPSNGKWYYSGKYNNLKPPTYAMLNVPYSWACDRSPSIVDDIPWGKLLEIGMLMLFGDADLDVTDQNGVKLGNASSLVTAFPAPSDGLSTNIPIIGPPLNPCLFSTCLPRFYAVRRARATRSTNQGIQISVKPRGNYTLAFKTNDGTFVAQGGMGDGSVDNLRVLGYDTSLAGQQYALQPGSAKTFSLQLVAPTRASIGPSLVYSLTGLSLGKQQLVNTALLNAGKAFKLGSRDASLLQYNLQISRGIDQDGIRNALTFNGVRSPASQVLVPTRLPTITVVGKRRAARR
ncbi:hypothetical protein ABPG77_004190 [Micractinium sp. CCAP 211/92]